MIVRKEPAVSSILADLAGQGLFKDMLQMRARSVVKHPIMALNMNLSTERLVRLAGQSDLSLDIHDLWRRGQSVFFSFGSETLTDGNSASQNA